MKQILVLDDDNDILYLVETTLRLNGYKVKTVSGWQQLDEAIAFSHPDLLLLDVGLSGADGRSICQRLKSETATCKLPIVLFSAHADLKESIDECHADGYIQKPYDLEQFLSIVKRFTGDAPALR